MRVYQCVVFGTGGVGKSASTIQFIKGSFVEQYDPTIEDCFCLRKQLDVDAQPCLLEILDTAGIDQLIALNDRTSATEKASSLFSRFINEITNSQETILRIKDPDEANSVPLVLVDNKADLEHEREFETQQGEALAEKWGCPYYETSARTGNNVSEVFIDVIRQIRRKDERTRPEAKG